MAPNTDRYAWHATDEVFVAPDPIPSFPAPTPYDAEAQAAARSRIDEIFGEIEEEMRLEAERAEQERIAREEAERRERERLEAERIAREEAERLEQERLEAEQRAREEAERLERERLEAERLERERLEAERREREEAERREREAAEAARREELARQLAAAAAASHMAPIDEESFVQLEDRPRRGAHFAMIADEDEAEDVPVEESETVDEADVTIDEAVVDTLEPEVEIPAAATEPETEPEASAAAIESETEPEAEAPAVATAPVAVALELLPEIEAEDVPVSPVSSLFDEMSPDAAEAVASLDNLDAFDDISTETAAAAPAEEMPAETPRAAFDDRLLGLNDFDDFDDLDEAVEADVEDEEAEGLRSDADEASGGEGPVADGAFSKLGDLDDLDEPEVVVIYDEEQIKEAVDDAPAATSGADPGLEATLVLDRVADAVKKLRVEGESAPVAPVREQKSEAVIHTEFQVSDDVKERLDVRKRGVASTKAGQGGGFFARIGAFVVKALHLDER